MTTIVSALGKPKELEGYKLTPLGGCCGVDELRGIYDWPAGVDLSGTQYIEIGKELPSYTGLTVMTINKSEHNLKAYEKVKERYDILFESDWVINKSPVAGVGGVSGVKLIVLKFKE